MSFTQQDGFEMLRVVAHFLAYEALHAMITIHRAFPRVRLASL